MNLKEIIDFEINNILVEYRTKFNLKEFKQIDNLKGMIVYANKHLNIDKNYQGYLGHGSSRITFILNNRSVLKIIRPNATEKGIAQNKEEIELYNKTKSDLITKVYDYDPDYEWVISELVRGIKDKEEFENLSGINGDDFGNIILMYRFYPNNNKVIKHLQNNIVLFGKLISKGKIKLKIEEYKQKIEDYKKYIFLIENNSFLKSAIKLVEEYDLLPNDLVELEHWGKAPDGRIVLLDYGFTEDVWQKHYKKDD